MSEKYQVLARKYRPKLFSEFISQEHTVRALTNALDNNRLHHAFLFTGTRGIGKTTIARILAKCMNCEQSISSKPCNSCSSCKEINNNQAIDLIEFDAASHTGVNDIREILENSQYLPSKSRYKIYLIDEVHMLSKSSFNALLKTLEEPPSHIKFLLATTDAKKLPITVLSRCLQFNLQKIPVKAIQDQLVKILIKEKIKFQDKALFYIASSGEGSMRDALSILDQAISYCAGNITEKEIKSMLGLINHNQTLQLLENLLNNKPQAVLDISENISQNGNSFHTTLKELLILLHQLSIANLIPDADMSDNIINLAQNTEQAKLQLYYQIGIDGLKYLDYAPNEHIGFNMVLMRMLAFTNNKDKPIEEEKKN